MNKISPAPGNIEVSGGRYEISVHYHMQPEIGVIRVGRVEDDSTCNLAIVVSIEFVKPESTLYVRVLARGKLFRYSLSPDQWTYGQKRTKALICKQNIADPQLDS